MRRHYAAAGAEGIPASLDAVRCRAALALSALAALAAVFALSASPALANSHVFTTTFGAAGSTPANPYPLTEPTDVAVDLSTHDIYVTDAGNRRVEKFDASGHLLLMFGKAVNKTAVQAESTEALQNVCVPSADECQAGSATASPGALTTPSWIEVDNSGGPSAGDVYVADTFGQIVSKFDSSGHLISSWSVGGQQAHSDGINGIAVNSAGDLIVMNTVYPYKMTRYSQDGSRIGEFTVPSGYGTEARGIAVDSRNRYYKGGRENGPGESGDYPRAQEFNETELISGLVAPGPVTGLATDPMSNDPYVDEQGTFVDHYPQCGEACTASETLGLGQLSNAHGISLDAPSDNLYVANTGDNNIVVFDALGPLVATGAASGVGHTTATLAGHIADGGRGTITGCRFEYGTDESYGAGSLPCEPAGPYGSEADVTAKLTGLQTETTYHYRLVATNAADNGVGSDRTVTPQFVLGTTTEPATNVTKESAELNGSFTGDGTPTTYHFAYGTTQAYEETTLERPAGSGTGPQTIPPTSIEGLQPHTTYHYRLVTTNSQGSTSGQDLTLITPDRPGIGRTLSSGVTATTAELHAQIDPHGTDTKVHFEYGTSINYGTSVPVPDEDIGSSNGPQEVSVALSNLQIGATYHFRVVAENALGRTVSEDQDFSFYPPACPNATVRQETSSNYLPDCRAYELVSPGEAGSVSLYPAGPNSPEASDPPRLAFGGWLNSIQGEGDSPINVWGDLYVSTRTPTGWTTRYVGIPGTESNNTNGPPGDPTNSGFFTPPAGTRTNVSMSTFLDWNDDSFGFASINPPPAFAPHAWAPDGSSLGVWPTAEGHTPGPVLNESPDLSHYYFISGGSVTSRGGEYLEAFTYEGGTAYDNDVEAGTITPIAFDSTGNSIEVKGVPGSSTDGSHILMSTAPCEDQAISSCSPGELYMRVDDATTYDIAKGHQVQYLGMTADGSKVYFTSPDQLTAADHDTSTDLYMWSEKGNALTLVSVGNGGTTGNTDECTASWIEKCGVEPYVNNFYNQAFYKGGMFGNGLSDNAIASKSGDIYFFSPERLDGNKGVRNRPNMYVYRDGTLQYVTTPEPSGGCESEGFFGCDPSPIARIQVSPDGEHMAFVTSSRVTSYENAGHSEMYTYSPAEGGEVHCVSCMPSGAPPTSDVWASSDGIFMTNDGRTFFSTKDALVPRDTDGLRDVYEYTEGRAQLISSGTSGKGAQKVFGLELPLFVAGLVGVSGDGTDAYFSTFSTLVPQDHNGNFLKFYDARSSGGFHFVAAPAPCEAADECAGSSSPPPAIPANRGGADLGTGGNVDQRRGGHRHKNKKKRHKSRKHAGKQGRHGNG